MPPGRTVKLCEECQQPLSDLAWTSGICTPCWWRTKGWLKKKQKGFPKR